ncbi:MAG: DsrE family protein [Gammaproteobacteria bacterium]|nr:DsrE family protein [Gammaproteobacteria bacterium]MCW8839363.1 DsrE family protein [Gammaproteobacteria bacterium]MCW8927588.1 DsrE family protein [Gammaproteobacteria bacterium]MCW8958699.1 DsrE family protein [Gammaproteobacteria bacterium]MCW8974016.1 DsrE family protein [Gammaproteobacteria bacterium]
MPEKRADSVLKKGFDGMRRRLLGGALAGVGVAALGSKSVAAQDDTGLDELRFPGDEPDHKVVFQFNHADLGYQDHVIFSVGEVLRKYGDNVKIIVVAFAEGIHILGKKPGRQVKQEIRQRVSSLAHYGVEFHACGNTMASLNWSEEDLVDFAQVVQVGAADLMELQEQGYAYISW